jgi:PAS domain S-box-containing protein
MTDQSNPARPVASPAGQPDGRRFRALVENGPLGVVLVGADARIAYTSRSLERMFGRSASELLQSDGFALVDARDRERLHELFAELVSVPDAVRSAEFRFVRPDGSVGWVEATARNLLHDPDVQALVVSARDVDERKRAELDLLHAAEERYRRLFEDNPIPMWVYDPATLRFLAVNEASVKHYGYSRDEFRSMTIADIRPEEDVPELMRSIGHDERGESWRHRTKDGTVIDVEVHSHALVFDGRPARLVIASDVTQRTRAEAELRRAFQAERDATTRLRKLDEMKNMFLNAVSHELRTPLASILGSALTLERIGAQLTEKERDDLLAAVTTNARKLERMLADLLDLDRLTRGVTRPRLEAVELGELVASVVAEPEFQVGRRIEVETHPMVFKVDGPKVQRIVENLLANAIKHTPPGTPIWVSVRRVPEGARIDVEDAGPGVPAEIRAVIFEPFRQGPDRTEHSPGVGIGLSLVKRFAELHRGSAWVEERPGGGAAFRVLLREATAPGPGE